MEQYQQQYAARKQEIDAHLASIFSKKLALQQELWEAMGYSVENGGKRIRPILLLESFRLFGGKKEEEDIVAAFYSALEMIHSYSLVHDDLPAMDNDEYRRGKLTTHAKYGHAAGILAGDGLLNLAFETALGARVPEENPQRLWRALGVLGQKAGIHGMVGGQAVDVALTGTPLGAEQLDFIYRLKTGALLEAAMVIGAILAGAEEEQVAVAEQIAASIGMAFQIQDDVLDEIGDAVKLGKPLHSDERNQKTTFVTIYGLEGARKQAAECTERALQLLQGVAGDSGFLCWLTNWLLHRDY